MPQHATLSLRALWTCCLCTSTVAFSARPLLPPARSAPLSLSLSSCSVGARSREPLIIAGAHRALHRCRSSCAAMRGIRTSTMLLIDPAQVEGVQRGAALVISGPSGVGKGSIIAMLQKQLGARVSLCISHTTRTAREGEQEGVHYYYSTREQMQEDISRGLFLEYAEVHGNLYGTSRDSLRRVCAAGKIAILDVDVRGAQALRDSGLEALYVFVSPPTLDTLEQRLRARGSETPESLVLRLAAAARQIENSKRAGLFDMTVVNDKLECAVSAVALRLMPQLRARPRVVFILGGPGCGKGTQSARLVSRMGYTHLSAGDVLRAEVATGSPEAVVIQRHLEQGSIVPVDITCGLLLKSMQGSLAQADPDQESVFLVDGFPRNIENLEGWMRVVGDDVAVAFVLLLECSQSVMRERLLERGKSSGRVDDNDAAIQKRLRVLEEETLPVIEILQKHRLIRRLQGDRDVEDVFRDVEALFLHELPPLLDSYE